MGEEAQPVYWAVAIQRDRWLRKSGFMKKSDSTSGRTAVNNEGKDTAIALLIALVVMYGSLALLLHFFGINRMGASKLDDLITVDVIHEDQTKSTYTNNVFPAPQMTDKVYIHVPLPKMRWVPSAVLCFPVYNSYVQVFSSENRRIFSAGTREMQNGVFPGHMLIEAPIPEECWGKEVTVLIQPLKENTTSVVYGVYAVQAKQVVWYPVLLNSQLTFMLLLNLFLNSVLLLSLTVILRIRGDSATDGILLMSFCAIAALWAMGYTNLIYLCSTNTALCAYGEYYLLYPMLPLLTGYMSCQNIRKAFKRYFRALTAVLAVVSAAVWAYSILVDQKAVVTFLPVYRLLIIISVLSGGIVIVSTRYRRDASRKLQSIGLLVTFALLCLEMLRSFIVGHAGERISDYPAIAETNLMLPIVVVFVSSMSVSYLSRFVRTRELERENTTLENLATQDALTGIPNRLFLVQAMQDMEDRKIRNYAIFFLDTNNLKKVNDEYGHKAGDQMLQLVGRALRESFDGRAGFFGRYGGDEFVACAYNPKDADKITACFQGIIDRANAAGYLPFPVSAAVGVEIHAEEDTRTTSQVLKAADDKMYENKKAMKGATNVR